jgi:hypothetical protein
LGVIVLLSASTLVHMYKCVSHAEARSTRSESVLQHFILSCDRVAAGVEEV